MKNAIFLFHCFKKCDDAKCLDVYALRYVPARANRRAQVRALRYVLSGTCTARVRTVRYMPLSTYGQVRTVRYVFRPGTCLGT